MVITFFGFLSFFPLKKGSARSHPDRRVGWGDSSHFPHIYDSTKTGGGRILSSSVLVVSHMTFMHSE